MSNLPHIVRGSILLDHAELLEEHRLMDEKEPGQTPAPSEVGNGTADTCGVICSTANCDPPKPKQQIFQPLLAGWSLPPAPSAR
jgi:hypothetical protein